MAKSNFEFDFNFNDLLSETVDEAFSCLGESPKQAIFFHLEKHFSIKQQEIPSNIEAFDGAIKKFFGVGATFLETLIVRRLYEKAGLPFQESPSKDSDFIEALVQLKQKIEK
jgi:hypothetical protein